MTLALLRLVRELHLLKRISANLRPDMSGTRICLVRAVQLDPVISM